MEKEMSDNKILQAIDYLEVQKRLFPKSFNVLSGHFDTAISALQEQAEREKGCEYCNDPGPFYDCCYVKPDGTAVEQRLIQKSENMFDVFVEERNINFCPKCGRDLRKPVEK